MGPTGAESSSFYPRLKKKNILTISIYPTSRNKSYIILEDRRVSKRSCNKLVIN